MLLLVCKQTKMHTLKNDTFGWHESNAFPTGCI